MSNALKNGKLVVFSVYFSLFVQKYVYLHQFITL